MHCHRNSCTVTVIPRWVTQFSDVRAGSVLPLDNRYLPNAMPRPGVAAPRVAFRAKLGAGGGTRTHTTLPSRDFKSLASTSSATSALLIPLAFSFQAGKCFPIDPLRFREIAKVAPAR